MKKKLKYLVFADGNSPHTLKWVKELNHHYEVYIISSSQVSEAIKVLIVDEKRFQLEIAVNQNGSTKAYLKEVFKLNKLIKSIAPDIVNAHYISSHGFLIALIKQFGYSKFKFVASAWGTDVLVFPFQNKLYFQIMRFILSKSDFITSDSDYMSKMIQNIKNKEVMTFTFGLESMPELDLQKKNPKLFFSNRSLSENYNIDHIIQVFKTIQEEDPLSRLIVSNEGPDKQKLINLIQQLELDKNVEFVGFLSQQKQAEIYSKASYYLSLPSSDSTSVSLLEALAYGCIPILSDIPANREWVHHMDNGLLIKEKLDLEDLKSLFQNKNRIIESNRKLIEEKGIFPNLMQKFVDKLKSKES